MMKRISGTSEPIWLFDNRPQGLVEIATHSSEREGVIQIYEERAQTPSGRLRLTDEQLQQAAEFCIRLTRYLGQ